MGTENLAKKVDLVVMTGSVPFITAGFLQQNHTDATLISGALSGMSNLLQEMLKHGELRHTELYNAHIYIRHLSQLSDSSNLVDNEIINNAKMSVAIIVREGELNREQELSFSELCYSLMVKIIERKDLSEKLKAGNIEGFIPENNIIREILAEAIEDYRKRARKSHFYEKPTYLQEKEKIVPISTNNEMIEERIEEFKLKIISDYYPKYFPKIPFIHFFGKTEYFDSIIQLKNNLEELVQTDEFKEKVISDLYNFIMQSGLIPIISFSGDIRKRLDIFYKNELPDLIHHFLTSYSKYHGPLGISIRCIDENLAKLPITDHNKIKWQFLKYYLEEINEQPFETIYFKQMIKILEIFNFSPEFLLEMKNLPDKNIFQEEFIQTYFNIINTHLENPIQLEGLATGDLLKDLNKINYTEKNQAPTLPSISSVAIMDDSNYQNYCSKKDDLISSFQNYIQKLIESAKVEKEKNNDLKNLDILLNDLFDIITEIELAITKGSFGNVIKNELKNITDLIYEENYDTSQTSILNIIESLETTDSLDEIFLELLINFKEKIQQIINTISLIKKTNPKQKISINISLINNNLNKALKEITSLIYIESFDELINLISDNKSLFNKTTISDFKSKIKEIKNIQGIIFSNSKAKQGKIDEELSDEISIVFDDIKLPKASAESSRYRDEFLIKAICKINYWVHEFLFGRFSLKNKTAPAMISTGLMFNNISDALSMEIGLMFDLLQSFTSSRTWLIGQLERIIDVVENKIINLDPNSDESYQIEKRFTIDVRYVEEQFKTKAERIISIITQLENDAEKKKINSENKKAYLESGFLGRSQELSIPSARKFLNELKTLNKSFSNKEIDEISKITSINFKDLTNHITSLQLLTEPLPSKDSEYSKRMREITNQLKKWDLDVYQLIQTKFYTKLEIREPYDILYTEEVLDNILRNILPTEINNSLEWLPNSKTERLELLRASYDLIPELFSSIGVMLHNNKPLRAFSKIALTTPTTRGEYVYTFPEIKPPLLSEEIRKFFIMSSVNEIGIVGRIYRYTPFNSEEPNNLTELIISDAFRRAYETIKDGLEQITKLGKKIHQGTQNLSEEIMTSYRIICDTLIRK
ncbi:MAG: hypothetical protein ACFFDW_13535 [Candidatus Thorarchaeota archaeon]